jgi:hypothetical protein
VKVQSDLFKIQLKKNSDDPIVESSFILPKSKILKIRFKDESDTKNYFIIANKTLNMALGKTIPNKEIKITDISFEKKNLSFKLTDFLRKEIERKSVGLLEVNLKVLDQEGHTIVNNVKKFIAQKEFSDISISLNQLSEGEYNAIINASDLLSGKEAQKVQVIQVSSSKPPNQGDF